MISIDAHCDAPSQMLRLRDYSLDNNHAQVDFPKMAAGGISGSFFALYIPARLSGKEALDYSLRLLGELERQVEANPGEVAFATSAEQLRSNAGNGLISILVGLENGSPIQQDMNLLHEFKRRRVRYVTLTHSADNQIGDSCSGCGTNGGLTDFGRELISEMNSCSMLVDLAHCADSTIRDVLEISKEPVLDTHTCCRELSRHRRNLPDSLMRGIAERGGVVCASIYPCFLSEKFVKVLEDSRLEEQMYIEDEFIADPADAEKRARWNALQDRLAALPRPGVDIICDHILHMVNVCGIEGVGIGTDYDGIEVTPQGLENISSFNVIFDALSSRGLTTGQIEKIAGGNILRLL